MFSHSPPRLLHRIAVLVVLRLLGKWPRVRGKQLTLKAKRKQTSHFSQDTVRELRKTTITPHVVQNLEGRTISENYKPTPD